jgi:hypothetical protein
VDGFTDARRTMADFLLLPSRPAVGEEIARLIRPYLPGVRVSAADCVRFLDALATGAGRQFLVYREELPDEEDVATALRDGFGAEPGDRMVHIQIGRPGEPKVRMEPISDLILVG